MSKSCLFISSSRSDVDSLQQSVVEPTVADLGFELTRSDLPQDASRVGSEWVEAFREPDLCIVDLSANSPSVLYGGGRRHGAGKPTIFLAHRSLRVSPLSLPSGLDVVFFDLGIPGNAELTKRRVQGALEKLIEKQPEPTEKRPVISGNSSVGRLLEQLKKDIAKGEADCQTIAKSPNEFDEAIDYLEQRRGSCDIDAFVAAAVLPVRAGSEAGFTYLKALASELLNSDELSEESVIPLTFTLANFYIQYQAAVAYSVNDLDKIFSLAIAKFENNHEIVKELTAYQALLQLYANNVQEAGERFQVSVEKYGCEKSDFWLKQIRHLIY